MQDQCEDRRVLIVDDEETISKTLTTIFTDHSYQVRAVRSAEEAIDVLAEWEPDLALLDVNLPKMNGVELAVALKTSHPNCRVLLLSGHPSTGDLLHTAMKAGHVFQIISKPVRPTLLLKAVANSLSASSNRPAATLSEMT
jgi:DNA-binding NtrC family response regulator